MKLESKTIIKGTITTLTGLHIGGSKSSLDIGGIDTAVIKDPLGVPYIPGSSLKGKLRALLAASINGAPDESSDDESIKKLFGYAGSRTESGEVTRLIVRDAHLDTEMFKRDFTDKGAILETQYTQEKAENKINRRAGKAEHPRSIERIPAGAVFNFELVLNNYSGEDPKQFIELIKQGFKLLEDDYLGGSGTRGYGKVKIESNIENADTKIYQE